MRVISLTLSAFGPYADETTIDFSLLGESGIYIVTGETGAGKTSLFDGISFALYGEASGEGREAKSLRSKYASDGARTFARLVFLYRGKQYTIKRSPEYVRFSKRTGKEVKEPADVELIMPDGRVITKIKEADAAVSDLIGLDKKQFSRVCMLAQGDFSRLLLSPTEERVKIFRKIFRTEQYARLTDKLAADANEAAALFKKKEEELKAVFAPFDIEYSTYEEGAEKLKGVLKAERERYKALQKERKELTAFRLSLAGELERARAEKEKEKKRGELTAKIADLAKRTEEEKAALAALLAQGEEIAALEKAFAAESGREGDYAAREEAEQSSRRAQRDILEKQKQEEALSRQIAAAKEEKAQKSLLSLPPDGEKERAKADLMRENSRLAELNALEKERALLEGRRALTAKREQEYLAADDRYRAASASAAALQSAFLKNRAGVLALSLKEGEPCPVCGSLSHPAPAALTGEAVGEEELAAAQEKEKKALETLHALSAALAGERAALQEKEEGLKKREAAFPSPVKEEKKKAEEHLAALSALLADLEKREQAARAAQARIAELEKAIGEGETRLARLREEEGALALEKAGADAILSRGGLRYPSYAAYKQAKAEAEGQIASFRQKKAEREEKIAALSRESDVAKGSLAALAGESIPLDGEREQKDAQAAARIAALDKEMKECTERGKEIALAEDGAVRALAAWQQAAERLSVLSPLAQTAGGTLAGAEKIKLETFVQTSYLDRVLLRANKRLDKMTDGQYELVRRETATDKKSQAGLDIDVIDNYNGTRRSASTLSGGECFMASLSLALGLSDEIQSSYGGVRIDCMFVDEGFGSLSDDALTRALDALSLVSGSHLLIGVISHVEKLKERIDKQIVVTKTRSGSKATVVC